MPDSARHDHGPAGLPSLPVLLLLGAAEFVLAFCLWLAITYAALVLVCAAIRCVDWNGLGVLIFAAPVTFIVAIGYWIAALQLGRRLRPRLTLDAVALAVTAASGVGLLVAASLR